MYTNANALFTGRVGALKDLARALLRDYAGSTQVTQAVRRMGGIDGIIEEDRLGLDIVYIQAKRWDDATVGRPDIQKFAGALQGQ